MCVTKALKLAVMFSSDINLITLINYMISGSPTGHGFASSPVVIKTQVMGYEGYPGGYDLIKLQQQKYTA